MTPLKSQLTCPVSVYSQCVCVYLVSVFYLFGMSPDRLYISLFGHANDVSCQRARLFRSAFLGPACPGPTPTYLRVYAGCERPARGFTSAGLLNSEAVLLAK